jgi:hypothetical protein
LKHHVRYFADEIEDQDLIDTPENSVEGIGCCVVGCKAFLHVRVGRNPDNKSACIDDCLTGRA